MHLDVCQPWYHYNVVHIHVYICISVIVLKVIIYFEILIDLDCSIVSIKSIVYQPLNFGQIDNFYHSFSRVLHTVLQVHVLIHSFKLEYIKWPTKKDNLQNNVLITPTSIQTDIVTNTNLPSQTNWHYMYMCTVNKHVPVQETVSLSQKE